MRIRAGRDIFSLGEVLPTPEGHIRIVARIPGPDYIDYEVEPMYRKMLTRFQPLTTVEKIKASYARTKETVYAWATK